MKEKQQQEIDRLGQEVVVSQNELKRTQDQHDCTRRQLRESNELKEKQQQEIDRLGRVIKATQEEKKQIWGMLGEKKQETLQLRREKKRLGKLLEGRDQALVGNKNGSNELEERIKKQQKVIIDLKETNNRILCAKAKCLRELSEAQSTNKLLETKIQTMIVKEQQEQERSKPSQADSSNAGIEDKISSNDNLQTLALPSDNHVVSTDPTALEEKTRKATKRKSVPVKNEDGVLSRKLRRIT